MNDNRTDSQRYAAWVNAVNKCAQKGWRHIKDWIFASPSGGNYDLSAADLDKLDYIAASKCFKA